MDDQVKTMGGALKKPHEKPEIVCSEPIDVRAVLCAKAGESRLPGPIFS